MARIVNSGAEWKDSTAECNPTGAVAGSALTTATFDTASPISGAVSFKNGSSTWALCSTAGTLGITLAHTVFARIVFTIDAFPSAQLGILSFLTTGAGPIAAILLNTDGTISNDASATVYPAISLNQTYVLEASCLIGSGSIDTFGWRVNGVVQDALTGLALSDTAIGYLRSGWIGNTNNGWYDDVVVNDDTGAAQNGYPGGGKLVLLKPISDNAVAAGWTNDANAATNLWDAVNNTPPVGIADTTSGTGLNQIRDATTGANEAYDANMTSYATAGIASGDTINVIVPQIATGAPVTTSAKTGSVGVVSNPTIAQLNFTDGGKVDTFWAGAAAATYPTGWKWSPGNTDYASSVTLGTSPVMRVQQIDSSTRIAMVCAMGMYVDYTPAATGTVYTKAGHGVEHG